MASAVRRRRLPILPSLRLSFPPVQPSTPRPLPPSPNAERRFSSSLCRRVVASTRSTPTARALEATDATPQHRRHLKPGPSQRPWTDWCVLARCAAAIPISSSVDGNQLAAAAAGVSRRRTVAAAAAAAWSPASASSSAKGSTRLPSSSWDRSLTISSGFSVGRQCNQYSHSCID